MTGDAELWRGVAFDAHVAAGRAFVARRIHAVPGLSRQHALWGANADRQCHRCHGSGSRVRRNPVDIVACWCVCRAAFRACLDKYAEVEAYPATTGGDWTCIADGAGARLVFARPREDFACDFWLTARRTLSEAEWAVFGLFMLRGWEWGPCARELHMDKGKLFHTIYRIERRLGRVFMELRPYALFPLDEYFCPVVKR